MPGLCGDESFLRGNLNGLMDSNRSSLEPLRRSCGNSAPAGAGRLGGFLKVMSSNGSGDCRTPPEAEALVGESEATVGPCTGEERLRGGVFADEAVSGWLVCLMVTASTPLVDLAGTMPDRSLLGLAGAMTEPPNVGRPGIMPAGLPKRLKLPLPQGLFNRPGSASPLPIIDGEGPEVVIPEVEPETALVGD